MSKFLLFVSTLLLVACGELEVSISSLDGDAVKLDHGAFMDVAATPHKKSFSAEDGYLLEGSGGAVLAQPSALTDGNSTIYLTNQSTIISLTK